MTTDIIFILFGAALIYLLKVKHDQEIKNNNNKLVQGIIELEKEKTRVLEALKSKQK